MSNNEPLGSLKGDSCERIKARGPLVIFCQGGDAAIPAENRSIQLQFRDVDDEPPVFVTRGDCDKCDTGCRTHHTSHTVDVRENDEYV